MINQIEIFQWLENCCNESDNDGNNFDWNIKIESISNPGWGIICNLEFTKWSGSKLDTTLIEKSEENWFRIYIENNIFRAVGDPYKLFYLLDKFKEFWITGKVTSK